MHTRATTRFSLRIYPDSVLRALCEPVERFDGELKDLVGEMLALTKAEGGIGLAAPQVGVTRRLFVAQIDHRPLCLVNPSVRASSGQDEMAEGCLSLPDVRVMVARRQTIRVAGYDQSGSRLELTAAGLWARVILHEVDHLNGVLICDRGKPIERKDDGPKQ